MNVKLAVLSWRVGFNQALTVMIAIRLVLHSFSAALVRLRLEQRRKNS